MREEESFGLTFWEVRKWLWESREQEITHMWHRGAFLTTFIIGTYTWYVRLLFAENVCVEYRAWGLLALSFACVVWSFLWIALSKGASAWYSIYEKAIRDLTNECTFGHPEEDAALLGIVGEKCPVVKCHNPCKNPEWSNFCLNGKGGTFSLPRINIAIGHLLLLGSSILYVRHIITFIYQYVPELFSGTTIGRGLQLILFLFANIAIVVGSLVYSKYFLNSVSLSKYQENLMAQKTHGSAHTLRAILIRIHQM